MRKLLRHATYLLLLGVISIYAAGAIALVAVVFVGAIAIDAVFAGWTRSPEQRRNRLIFEEARDLAQH